MKTQLKEFAKQVGKTFYKTLFLMPKDSWDDAFDELTETLKNIPKDKTVVLFFDEFHGWQLHAQNY